MKEIDKQMSEEYGGSWRVPNIFKLVNNLFEKFDPILDMKSNRVATVYLDKVHPSNEVILKYLLERAVCMDQMYAVISIHCIRDDALDKNKLSTLVITDMKAENSRNYIPSGAAPLMGYIKQNNVQEATGTVGAIVGLPNDSEVKLGIVTASHNFGSIFMEHCGSAQEFNPIPPADEAGNDIAVVEFSNQWILGDNCCSNVIRFTEIIASIE
jgi:hypothetical protein